MNEETRKILTRELRDANIRIFKDRCPSSLPLFSLPARKLNLTTEEIRKKLRGGKHGKKTD